MRGLDSDEARLLDIMARDEGPALWADAATERVLDRLVADGRVRTYPWDDPATGAWGQTWTLTPLGRLARRVGRDLPLPTAPR